MDLLTHPPHRSSITPAHREVMQRICGVEGKMTLETFSEWYLYFIFKGEDEEEEEEERDFKVSGGFQSLLVPKDGEYYRCDNCRVVNTWTTRTCIACDTLAPHAVRLDKLSPSLPPSPSLIMTADYHSLPMLEHPA